MIRTDMTRWKRGFCLGLACFASIVQFPAASAGAASASRPRAAVDVVHDVPYGGAERPELLLDVYRPQTSEGEAPVVIGVHGGGWVSGDKLQFAPQSRALARAGFLVVDANYALEPSLGPGFPRQIDDLRAALRWTRKHARSYGGDPDRMAVVGGSAGGYLAAMLGLTADAGRRVRGIASLSGPMDFVALVEELRGEVRACTSGPCTAVVRTARENLRSFLGCDPLACPTALLQRASPVTHVNPRSPPFFLANSTEEAIPAEQAVTMGRALRAAGVEAQVLLLPGTLHSVEYLPDISGQLLRFLRAATAVTPATGASASEADDSGRNPWRAVAGIALVCVVLLGVGAAVSRRF
jgi:acetyl esterase/lipase